MTNKYFEIKIEADAITELLKDISSDLKDLSPLMKVARVAMKNIVNENFETEGTATGEKWKEWSDKYKKLRLKKGKTGNILSLDGYLKRSITAKSGKDWAMIGTNKKYAAIHNFGGDIKRHGKKIGTMPQREFMRFDNNALNDLYAELYLEAKHLIFEQNVRRQVYG